MLSVRVPSCEMLCGGEELDAPQQKSDHVNEQVHFTVAPTHPALPLCAGEAMGHKRPISISEIRKK